MAVRFDCINWPLTSRDAYFFGNACKWSNWARSASVDLFESSFGAGEKRGERMRLSWEASGASNILCASGYNRHIEVANSHYMSRVSFRLGQVRQQSIQIKLYIKAFFLKFKGQPHCPHRMEEETGRSLFEFSPTVLMKFMYTLRQGKTLGQRFTSSQPSKWNRKERKQGRARIRKRITDTCYGSGNQIKKIWGGFKWRANPWPLN